MLAAVALWILTATSVVESARTDLGASASGGASYSTAPTTAPPGAEPPEQAATQPAAPTNLTIDTLTGRRAKLSWSWVGNGTVAYTVEARALPNGPTGIAHVGPRLVGGVLDNAPPELEIILGAIVGAAGLASHDTYQFRVKSVVGGVDSGWSETVTIMDSPLLQSRGAAYFHSGTAYLRWAAVPDAFGYTVRYREISGNHWNHPTWDLTDDKLGVWETDNVRLGTVSGAGNKMATITGLNANGPIYAVQLNYETASGKVFSARDAYIWASSVKPETAATPRGIDRVATFPYFGHLASTTYSYRICADDFPHAIWVPPVDPTDPVDTAERDMWVTMIQAAIGTWDIATANHISTSRDSTACDRPEWPDLGDVSWYCVRHAVRCAFLLGIEQIIANDTGVDLGGNLISMIDLTRSTEQADTTNEIRIIDTAQLTDIELLTGIYKLCILEAPGCVTSPNYYGDQAADESIQSADIFLNWQKINTTERRTPVLKPDRTQFNECIPRGNTSRFSDYIYGLVVHEAGHALGLSGASRAAVIWQDEDAIYRASHPTVGPSVMNYDTKPDCFPHPLDVLAVHALHQDQYTAPALAPRPSVHIRAQVSSITEGGIAGFTVTRTGGTASDLAVWLRETEVGSRRGIASTEPQTLVIRSGSHSATRFLRTTRDTVTQGESTVTVAVIHDLTSYDISAGLGSASVTVTDPPPPPPPPQPQIIVLPQGEFVEVIWQGAMTHVDSVASHITSADGFCIYRWVEADMQWVSYIRGAPTIVNEAFGTHVNTGDRLTMVSRERSHTIVVPVARASARSADAPEGARTDTSAAPGWTAVVTCETGPSPVRLGVASTEAEAISAATWFIDSPSGCGGAGSYKVDAPAQDGG